MNAPTSSLAAGLLVETSAARISVATPCGRLSLRARSGLGPIGTALGLSLPERIGLCTASGAFEAIRLGPDEWMIHAPEAQVVGIETALAALYDRHPHSLVDVSGREITFVIDGSQAAELLTLGCPRDIGGIKPGEGRRTVFDGVAVILWRAGENDFRMDVWHSFAPYLFNLLDTGCRELAAATP